MSLPAFPPHLTQMSEFIGQSILAEVSTKRRGKGSNPRIYKGLSLLLLLCPNQTVASFFLIFKPELMASAISQSFR